MINDFKKIGKMVLENEGYYEIDNIDKKREKLLFYQSLIPKIKIKNEEKVLDGKALVLNFNLKNKYFEFKLSDRDLEKDNREYFLAFALGAPRDKKKFLSTNNLSTFYDKIFSDSVNYIVSKKENNKSKEWFKENISENYLKFLKSLFDSYYIKKGKKIYLNPELLEDSQKKKFFAIKENYPKKKIPELYDRMLNKIYYDSDSKNNTNFPTVSIIKFNDKSILESENGRFKHDYLNVCYYDLLERFVIEKGRKNKKCHICNENSTIIQEMPLPMKFYGTTNNLNFEQLTNSKAYRSFAVCESCLPEILTGMKFVENNFKKYLFDLSTFIVPQNNDKKIFKKRIFRRVIDLLKVKKSEYKTEINELSKIVSSIERRKLNFNLMFYFHPPGSQQFDILKMISNIKLNSLFRKMELFDKYSEIYKFNKLENFNNLTLYDIRNILFPSWFSHKKRLDYDVFGKELINFLERFLTNKKISYFELINKFIKINKKRKNTGVVDKLAAMKLNLFFSILNKLNKLKTGGNMKEGKYLSEISKKEYSNFFETHSDIYAENGFRQGLFLLGTIISKIIYKQKAKSSTFLKKMNLEGIPARRLIGLINQVKEYTKIYKVYEEPGIWGNIMDRLQGIQNSKIKPNEIVFYILSGISYEDYLGFKFNSEKKLKDNKTKGE